MVFVRMTGIFVIAPIFGRKNIPSYYKIGFAFFLSLIAINFVEISQIEKVTTLLEFSFIIMSEFIVGIIIGFIAYLVFSAIYLAGQLIDMQIGFGVVNVLDPMSNIQIPITANFYMIIATLIFLGFDGHHILINAVFESYKYIPLGSLNANAKLIDDLLVTFGTSFSMGFKIAAPITAAVMITDVALGIMSKTMPQLNIFMVGMPLKIIMGIFIIIITMGGFITIVKMIITNIDSDLTRIIRDLGFIIWQM
ncbi:MAG: flagellar biosynthetic protein FliR [Clostridiales bacterium]